MRTLVTGATGLIGTAVSARLRAEGHHVIGVARGLPNESLHHSALIRADIGKMIHEAQWLPQLKDVNAVVNCAGILQDAPGDSTASVHTHGVGALFRACIQAGVRRVVHLSAIGVERSASTTFSRTKLAGDKILMSLDLEWVILRPSVVVGRGAYGGSALFRGLASLPILPRPSGSAPLQLVQLDELVETICFFMRSDAPTQVALDIAGPERLSLTEIVFAYRKWLGFKAPTVITLPRSLQTIMYRVGDFLGLLGWRPPLRSTVATEIRRGATGDNKEWIRITGIKPRRLSEALAAEPASVQEKWFAQLYFFKPLVLTVFSLFWIVTGIISLGPGWDIGMDLMRQGGVEEIGPLLISAGAIADILIGTGIAIRRTARAALWGALALSLAYTIIGTFLVPGLWADPLGPMLKIWPIMALNLVAIAILRDR